MLNAVNGDVGAFSEHAPPNPHLFDAIAGTNGIQHAAVRKGTIEDEHLWFVLVENHRQIFFHHGVPFARRHLSMLLSPSQMIGRKILIVEDLQRRHGGEKHNFGVWGLYSQSLRKGIHSGEMTKADPVCGKENNTVSKFNFIF